MKTIATLIAFLLPMLANAEIYHVNSTISDTAGCVGWIETDGTLGRLETENIIAYRLEVRDSTGTFVLTEENSIYRIYVDRSYYPHENDPTPVIATETELIFEYGDWDSYFGVWINYGPVWALSHRNPFSGDFQWHTEIAGSGANKEWIVRGPDDYVFATTVTPWSVPQSVVPASIRRWDR